MAQRVRLGLCHAKYLGFSLASWINCCLRRWWTRSRCRAGLGTRSSFPKIRLVAGSLLSTPGTRTTRCLCAEHFVRSFQGCRDDGMALGCVRVDGSRFLSGAARCQFLRKLDRNSFACVIQRLQPHRRYREDSGAGRSWTATVSRRRADRNPGIRRPGDSTISISKYKSSNIYTMRPSFASCRITPIG